MTRRRTDRIEAVVSKYTADRQIEREQGVAANR